MSKMILFISFAFGVSTASANDLDLKEPKLMQWKQGAWVEVIGGIRPPEKALQVRHERLSAKEIVVIGELVWEIIKQGEPVLNFESERMSVLPKQAQSSFDLSHWMPPRGDVYKVVYENMFGFEMISFSYRLVFTPGGQFNGTGLFLSNVAIEPMDVDVTWGYDLNAKFEAMDVVNLNSAEDPVAGLELKLTWSIESLVQKTLHQTSFFIQGDGYWQPL